jgi:hypothetical protein
MSNNKQVTIVMMIVIGVITVTALIVSLATSGCQ